MVHWLMVISSWFIVHGSLVNWLGQLALSPCCAAAYDMQTEMSSLPTGGLYLPISKHVGILTYYQTIVKKKMKKKHFFWSSPATALLTRNRVITNGMLNITGW